MMMMMMMIIIIIFIMIMIMIIIIGTVLVSEGIRCLECNAYFQGRRGRTCDEPMNRTNCAACLKVVTKVQINNGWLLRKSKLALQANHHDHNPAVTTLNRSH